MAEEQNEYGLPVGKGEKRRTARLLPRFYRTEPNKKLLFLSWFFNGLTLPSIFLVIGF